MGKESRRKFLKSAGSAAMMRSLGLDTLLWNALLANMFATARAQSQSLISEKNYININMGGGPPRYMSDHWLKTSESDPEVASSPYGSTAFVNDSSNKVVGFSYRTFKYGNYLVPNLFQTFSPSEQAMLLDSMLVIQGYGTGIDGHGLNSQLQQHPLASAPSMSGFVADNSSRPFQAARHPEGRTGRFVSKKSLTINLLHETNPLNTLLGALVRSSRTRTLATSTGAAEAFDEVRRALNSVKEPTLAVKIAKDNLKNSHELLKSSLSGFAADWDTLFAKYDAAVHSAMRDQWIPGINCNPARTQQISFQVDDTDGRFDTGTGDGYPSNGSNICALAEKASNNMIVRGMALSEFAIKNKLVSSLEIHGGYISSLNLTPGTGKFTGFNLGNDMHGAGGFMAFVAMSAYHRGIYAGVLKLQEALRASGDWKNTVVHFTSEFDRVISKKATGSGHGTEQMVSSVISGGITGGPYVVGNILTPADVNGPLVSQGHALPIDNYAVSDRPTPIMMNATVVELLDPPYNPWRNFQPPLISVNPNGTLSLPYGRGKVIAG